MMKRQNANPGVAGEPATPLVSTHPISTHRPFSTCSFPVFIYFPNCSITHKKNELFFERRHDSLRQLFDGAPIIYQLPPQISQIIDIKKKKKKTIASYHTNTDSNGQV